MEIKAWAIVDKNNYPNHNALTNMLAIFYTKKEALECIKNSPIKTGGRIKKVIITI